MASGMTTYMCVWYLGIVCCLPQVCASDVYVMLMIESRHCIPQVRVGDVYVRLVVTNGSCIPQVRVGNAYTQHSSTTSSYRL